MCCHHRCSSTRETILDLTHIDLKPKSQNIIISWANATELDKIIPYTEEKSCGISSSQFSMEHGPNKRTIEHSTNINSLGTGQKGEV